jgi:hypothetical protein
MVVWGVGMSDDAQRDSVWGRLRRLLSTRSVRRRFRVVGAGYAVVVVFLVSLGVVRLVWPTLVVWAALALAAAVAAPLALAMIYDRLTGLKTPWFELTLAAVTVMTVTVEAPEEPAAAVQQMKSSATRELVEYLSDVIGHGGIEAAQVNLGREPYWWSTRLYLLAALAADYTKIQRLIFVTGGAERRYIGMAPPAGVRTLLAARFPPYEQAYENLQANMDRLQPSAGQVRDIAYRWPTILENEVGSNEESVKEFVTEDCLRGWLDVELDPSRVEWDGLPENAIFYKVLNRDVDYVALVESGRFDRVVNRASLAMSIATSALRRSVG